MVCIMVSIMVRYIDPKMGSVSREVDPMDGISLYIYTLACAR